MGFQPANPDFEARVRESFARQQVMATLGARIARIAPGEVDLELPFRTELTQQHGYLHAGIVTTLLDSACGYAAFTLMPVEATVLSVEFKTNLLAPAEGETLLARGRVLRAGRTLTVCEARGIMLKGGKQTDVAHMVATMMALHGKSDRA